MFSLSLLCVTEKLPGEIPKGIDDGLIVKFTFVGIFFSIYFMVV